MTLHFQKPQIIELPPLKLQFWRYFEIFRDQPYTFLLDSALESARQGQYSFMGGEPFLAFQAKRQPEKNSSTMADCTTIEFLDVQRGRRETPKVTKETQEPFAVLRKLFNSYGTDTTVSAEHEIPFFRGAVGYFGYETGHFFEHLPNRAEDDLGLPDIYLMFFNRVLVHCHKTEKTCLSWRGVGVEDRDAECEAIIQQIELFESSSPLSPYPRPLSQRERGELVEVQSHFDKSTYSQAVQTAKDHIAAGDVYQVCLTHRLETPLQGGTAWDLYRELRRINPAPFASFLRFPEVEIVSSSPERFLKLDRNGLAESRPIKGTRPRGKTQEEDAHLESELKARPRIGPKT